MWNDAVVQAYLCGFSRKFAVKYSYLISIPAVLGSLFLELGQFTTPKMSVSLGFTYVFGMIVAGGWIFYDTQSAPHFAACETALFRILLFCGRSHSAY